jgi:topoisomerase-4 subunit A
VIVLAASGKSFTIDAAAIPAGRGDGSPVNTLVNSSSDDIVWMGTGDLNRPLLMNSSAGLGFVCKLGDLVAKTKQGKDFMSVAEGAHAQAPAPLEPATAGGAGEAKGGEAKGAGAGGGKGAGARYVAALSSDARLLLFPLEEVPVRPNGGVGVQLIALPDKVTLAAVAVSDGKTLVVSGIRRKNRAVETLDARQLAEHMGKRAQRGKVCDAGFRPDRIGS